MPFIRFFALLSVFILGLSYGHNSSANDFADLLGDLAQRYVAKTITDSLNGTGSNEYETAQSGAPHYLHLKKGRVLRTAPSLHASKHTFRRNGKEATIKNLSYTLNSKVVEETRPGTNTRTRIRWYELKNGKGDLYYISEAGLPDRTKSTLDRLIAAQPKPHFLPPLPERKIKTSCNPNSGSFKIPRAGLTCTDDLDKDSCIKKAFRAANFQLEKGMDIQGTYQNRQARRMSGSLKKLYISDQPFNFQYPNTNTKGRASAEIYSANSNFNDTIFANGSYCVDSTHKMAIYEATLIDKNGNYYTRNYILSKVNQQRGRPLYSPRYRETAPVTGLKDIGNGVPIGL